MSAVNEYIEKCLAECPAGAEDLLLAALIKKLLPKYGPDEQFEVFDEAGVCLGYFERGLDPAYEEEQYQEMMAALRQQEAGEPEEPGIPGEQFGAEQHRIIAELQQQIAEEALRAEKSA